MHHRMRQTLLIIAFMLLITQCPVRAGALNFTAEEKEYLSQGHILTAASIDGAAPLHYMYNGEIRGIAIQVLKKIGEMTGLQFHYKLYDSIEEVYNSKPDLIFGITEHYAQENTVLSEPYLKTETILFINSAVDPDDLENKKYTGIKGGTLPKGVREQNFIHAKSREESLKFVETGKADYGYGNIYSVAFYTIRNSYKNVVIIPTEQEERNYSLGLTGENPVLLSILNKAIANLDEAQMQNVILEAAASVERNINLDLIMDIYGVPIFVVMSIILTILLLSVIQNLKANKELKIQNKRYELLSQISNEFLFEYFPKTRQLELTGKSNLLVDIHEKDSKTLNLIKDTLHNLDGEQTTAVIQLPLAQSKIGTFRAVTTRIKDDTGSTVSIIGKLINISEEAEEKERLIYNAQLDGATGLYNAATTETLIHQSMDQRKTNRIDALILVDCDKLKMINDNYGHLAGNQGIVDIAQCLTTTFQGTDIVGRIGGDEFCVYMENIPDFEFVQNKCLQFNSQLRNKERHFPLTVSIGIAFLTKEEGYKSLFERADNALYKAKEINEGDSIVVSD